MAASACAGKFDIVSNFAGPNPFADSATFGNSQVVIVLKIEPKLRGQTEVLSQANGSLRTDSPVSPDDFIDAGKIERFRQFISTHAHWLHELGLENFSRMNRKHLPRFGHACPLPSDNRRSLPRR